MIVIGITGHPAAGKDTIADYLVTKGFQKFSMSDILRDDMRNLGLPLDRDTMRVFAERRKADLGNDYLCHKVLKKISGNSVIPSVRATLEVKTFKEKLGNDFKMITVEAPIEKRFEWAKERQREGDDITFEKFKEQEEKERNSSSGSQEVDKVIELSQIKIENNGTKEDLYKKIDDLLLSQSFNTN